jgi:uncharacterized protein with von Willebrand factor type A (vWA) domain
MADVPDFGAAREHVLTELVRFERRLRAEGVPVPSTAALSAVEALAEVGLRDRAAVRAATHATLVRDPRDSETFEDLFGEFWYRLRTGLEATAAHDATGDRAGGVDGEEQSADTDVDGVLANGASDDGVDADVAADLETSGSGVDTDEWTIESRRVADTDTDEPPLEEYVADQRAGTYSAVGTRTGVGDDDTPGTERVAAATMQRFERALATLSGRRWSGAQSGDAIDARRALRASLGTGGVAVSLPPRERTRTAFRACVVVDVSRSVLDAVDRRFLLSVLDALVANGRSVRVFFFDTEIREVTDAFADARGDPASALERAEVAWGGGTRIGASLDTLRRQWPTAVDRRGVTLVISDGLEVGEIDELERSLSWLARQSRAVVWLNPLAASAAWEPTCRGMAAALPYVDALFAFGGNADLDEAARQLAERGPHGAVGYEYDFRDRSEAGDSGTGGVSSD